MIICLSTCYVRWVGFVSFGGNDCGKRNQEFLINKAEEGIKTAFPVGRRKVQHSNQAEG